MPVLGGHEMEMPDITEDEADRALLQLEVQLSDENVDSVVRYADRRAA